MYMLLRNVLCTITYCIIHNIIFYFTYFRPLIAGLAVHESLHLLSIMQMFMLNKIRGHFSTACHDATPSDGMMKERLWEQFGRLTPHNTPHFSLLTAPTAFKGRLFAAYGAVVVGVVKKHTRPSGFSYGKQAGHSGATVTFSPHAKSCKR